MHYNIPSNNINRFETEKQADEKRKKTTSKIRSLTIRRLVEDRDTNEKNDQQH